MNTISDVITRLTEIMQECERTQSSMGYFAAMYKRMTAAVAEGILNNDFEDGPRMEKLDIIFAGRYIDAWDAWHSKAACSSSWQSTFDNGSDTSMTVIQHLLSGINTHINLDLSIASAAVAPGNSIYALQRDFDRINSIITGLMDDIQEALCRVWFPLRLLRSIANHREEPVLNFSIAIARKTAWANAILLANMNAGQQSSQVSQIDNMVNLIGRKIKSPGIWPQFLLKIIRWMEYDDISRTIRIIDTTVIN